MQNNNNITSDINFAVSQLKAGNLVAFPTETVYGLGADAKNPDAIKKVFELKGRPTEHPLIVHIAAADQLPAWAQNIPNAAWILAEQFWPGPLTLILQKQPHVSTLITGGQATIGLRIPNHALTLELLRRFNSGIVGPSANKYGRVSPTSALHVAHDLGNAVAAILDGGRCNIGIESTIVDLTGEQPIIRRVGAISAAEIARALKQEVKINLKRDENIRTPGSHEAHYAPHTAVELLATEQFFNVAQNYLQQNKSFSVISLHAMPANFNPNIQWQQMSNDPQEYAQDLYASLRAHDQLQNSLILIEQPPMTEEWAAVLDRLSRASAK